ncbi:hypothetical protein CgunFtcFv8_000942 [Champsocephalus gunnari]|uniref:Uncharacterized protein n=1 Tax=Champsocephalus gunnari TaxID=52237 RepID=A0AAN8DJ75_CHAGU|nr:hypothetical protein CgunFtcFv8_000942 [Champsocephalus gunnari]
MQAFVPRSYLTPVRDEEAESQRKAKSRHARQTRRSTQGVTLTDLKEAQKTTGASPAERQTEEGICLRKGSSDDRRLRISPTESTGTEISTKWSKMDDQGNIEPRLEAVAESPVPNLPYSSVAGSCGLLSNTSFRAGERMWRDENQNPVEKAAEMTFAATLQQKRHFSEHSEYNTAEKDSPGGPATPSSSLLERQSRRTSHPLLLSLSRFAFSHHMAEVSRHTIPYWAN